MPSRRPLSPLLAACASLTLPLSAQALRGGDLVTPDYSTNAVYRVDSAGAISTLYAGPLLTGPSGVTATRSGDVVVADFGSNSLLRIDAATGTATRFATNVGGPLRLCEDFDGSFVLTSNSGRSLLRVQQNGQTTTVASGPPFNRPYDVSLDWNGDYLVADDYAPGVFRVTPAGVITPIRVGLPLRLPQGVALLPNGDYAVIDGITDMVYRCGRATARLDFSLLPPGALTGLLFFQQGFTLTPGLQVGSVCNALRLPMQ